LKPNKSALTQLGLSNAIEAQSLADRYLGDIIERPRITAVEAIEEAAGGGDRHARVTFINITKMLRFKRWNTMRSVRNDRVGDISGTSQSRSAE